MIVNINTIIRLILCVKYFRTANSVATKMFCMKILFKSNNQHILFPWLCLTFSAIECADSCSIYPLAQSLVPTTLQIYSVVSINGLLSDNQYLAILTETNLAL